MPCRLRARNLQGLFALRRWLAEHRPDVVNTHSSTDTWLTALARLTLDGLAVVRTRHISAPVPRNLPSRWLYRHAVDRIATTGEALRLQLVRGLDLPPDHVISVPTGIDLEHYCPQPEEIRVRIRAELGVSPAAKVIGIVATLRSWKGHTYLLQAFSSLAAKHPELELIIAGDGPMREQIAGWAAQSGVAGRIHLTGQREDVPAILAAMDVFVLPSYANEGVPQALMQAMAAGLPVVSTHVGAIDELVADKLSGFLVEPKNALQLEEKLAEIAAKSRVVRPFRPKRAGNRGGALFPRCHAGCHGRYFLFLCAALIACRAPHENCFHYHQSQRRGRGKGGRQAGFSVGAKIS